MRTREIMVDSPTAPSVPALLALCEGCGGEVFKVFQIVGQHHLHLQCVRCPRSFCSGDCGALTVNTVEGGD